MGCSSSSPVRVSNSRQREKQSEMKPSQTVMKVEEDSGPDNFLQKSFEMITKTIGAIASPPNQMAVVCLNNDAFPILTSVINRHSMELPIIAASFSKRGRVACFSQVEFLSNSILQIGNTMKLVTRTINWLCDGLIEKSPIGILTRYPETKQTINDYLLKLQMNPVMEFNKKSEFSDMKLIVITTDFIVTNKIFSSLVRFLFQGGAVAVFYNHIPYQKLSINSLLLRFGLSYSRQYVNIDTFSTKMLDTSHDYDKVKIHNLFFLIETLKKILSENYIDLKSLEKHVINIKNYISCSNERMVEPLTELMAAAWEFLNKTNYSNGKMICMNTSQRIIAILILMIYQKIPSESARSIPEVKIFPGLPSQSISFGAYTKSFDLFDSSWFGTGLYLPPRATATIVTDKQYPSVMIQVGSHTESLIAKNKPWKRWPIVALGFPLFKEEITISSQFGGIIYVTTSDENIEKISLDFTGVSEYPLYNQDNPEVWERTKNIEIPWGEIQTKSLIITLPTEKMKQLDLPKVTTYISKLHSLVLGFLGTSYLHPDRVVFDIDSVKRHVTTYPLVERIRKIDVLLGKVDKPSKALFDFFTRIAINDIKENLFEPEIEEVFAVFSVVIAFLNVFPKTNPFKFVHIQNPKLFKNFWAIYTKGNKAWLTEALISFQSTSNDFPESTEDIWNKFVEKLSNVAKCNFLPLLDWYCPTPLNNQLRLEKLPPFKYVV